MQKKNIFTIITITYNSDKYLEQTIESVLKQTFKDIEYIIVDGGSKDGTLGIIKKYESRLARWISEKDHGISDAMNKGIEMASGDFVGIIHADDWLEENAVEKAFNAFKNTGADIICGKIRYWRDGSPDYVFNSDPSKLNKEMTVNHPSVFVKNEAYKKYGMFDLKYKYAMDYDLLLRFKNKGLKFVNLDRIVANMRLEGVSDKNWRKGLYESYLIKVANGINVKEAYHYYVWQVLRTSVSRLFKMIGLEMVVAFYRKKLSILKKEKMPTQ